MICINLLIIGRQRMNFQLEFDVIRSITVSCTAAVYHWKILVSCTGTVVHYIIRRFTPSWTLYRHEMLLIFIRLQPSSWEKSIHCVCPGDYFISSVTDTGQLMVEMSIFFSLNNIIRQFGDANTNRAIISLANIVREFKVLYILNICI